MTVDIEAAHSTRIVSTDTEKRFDAITLRDTDPEVLKCVIDQSKIAGNQAFKDGHYKGMASLGLETARTCRYQDLYSGALKL